MKTAEFATYLLVAAVWIVTPGQDTAITVRNSLRGGRSAGLSTTAGIVMGQQFWISITVAGVSAVVATSHRLFVALELVGSIYLCYLGLRSLGAAVRGHAQLALASTGGGPTNAVDGLRQGLVSNLSNPKAGGFFVSVLPHFATAWTGLVLLGTTFSIMTLSWLSAYVLIVTKIQSLIRKPRVSKGLEAVTGTVLLVLGVRLAVESL